MLPLGMILLTNCASHPICLRAGHDQSANFESVPEVMKSSILHWTDPCDYLTTHSLTTAASHTQFLGLNTCISGSTA